MKEIGVMWMIRKGSIFRKYLIFFITAGFLPIILSAFAMFSLYERNTAENTMNNIDYLMNYLAGSNFYGVGRYEGYQQLY